MFEEIRENLINNFLNKNYLWTCCTMKSSIISDITKRCPFPVNAPGDNYSILQMNLGNDIILSFDLEWESREIQNNNKPMISYRLIKIS